MCDGESGQKGKDEYVHDAEDVKLSDGIAEIDQITDHLKDTGHSQLVTSRPRNGWIFLALFHELTWGMYPVSTRYIQVVLGLNGLIVLSCSFALALCVIQVGTRPGLGGRDGWWIGLRYSLLTFSRGATNMLSSKFTSALYCQLITQLTPLVIVMLSRVFLAEPLPKFFFPSLLIATSGSLLVIGGQSGFKWSGITGGDIIGLGLAMVSIFFLAGMFVFIKASNSSLTKPVLLSWQFMNTLPLGLLAMATTADPAESFHRFGDLSWHGMVICVVFAIYHVLFGNLCQVICVRKVGPSFLGSLQPLRLLSNIIGGYIVLGEPVRSVMSWMGLLLIAGALTAFIFAQKQKDSPSAAPTLSTTPHQDAVKYGKVSG